MTEAPLPLMLDEEPWRLLVKLFKGTRWARKLGAAEVVTEEDFTFRQLRLSMDELDSLWEAVSSAMDAFEAGEEVGHLEAVLRSIGVAMDGF